LDALNDYGIGLFLQGDLKAAAAAFEKITQADPQNPDGWTNIGRVLVQEGILRRAKSAGEILSITRGLRGRISLRAASRRWRIRRRDRSFANRARAVPARPCCAQRLGRVLFLEKRYADAVKEFEQTLSIDPEDLQAHYNLMLCYNGLGNDAKANEHKARYLRFKAMIGAGNHRALPPNSSEDNNERQAIHEHVSVRAYAGAGQEAGCCAWLGAKCNRERTRPGGSE